MPVLALLVALSTQDKVLTVLAAVAIAHYRRDSARTTYQSEVNRLTATHRLHPSASLCCLLLLLLGNAFLLNLLQSIGLFFKANAA